MPKFTIDLSQKAVDKLQLQHVDRSNGANGTALTLKDWIVLHLNELAITADLPAAIDHVRAIDERENREEQDQGQPRRLRYVRPGQNLPCVPLANRRPKSPVGRNNSVSVRMIMP